MDGQLLTLEARQTGKVWREGLKRVGEGVGVVREIRQGRGRGKKKGEEEGGGRVAEVQRRGRLRRTGGERGEPERKRRD